MRDDFSTLDIVAALGIPRERLRDWMNRGFVKPSIPAEGQGTRAVFTRHDIYRVALFAELTQRGFKRENAAGFVREMKKQKILADETDFIVFTYTPVEPGKENLNVTGLKNNQFLSMQGPLLSDGSFGPAEWQYMQVINFKRIKVFIDKMLANIE